MSRVGLGRVFNVATSATTAAARVRMHDAGSISFVLIGATSGAATIQEANAASGGTAQDLAVITEYFTQASGVWTRRTQAAAATVTAVTGGLLVVEIRSEQLSDGFKWLTASHSAGSFVAIAYDLAVQRAPAALATAIT